MKKHQIEKIQRFFFLDYQKNVQNALLILIMLMATNIVYAEPDSATGWKINEPSETDTTEELTFEEPQPIKEPQPGNEPQSGNDQSIEQSQPEQVKEPQFTQEQSVEQLSATVEPDTPTFEEPDTLSSESSAVELDSSDELPLTKPTSREVSAELNANLTAQFQRISALKQTEEAYSDKLGEEYLNYGLLLQQAGRIDEAREAIIDAWHITKVNHGVYSMEQRPMLRALFDINLTLQDTEDLEDVFGKLIWIENKNPRNRDRYSLDLAIQLGHHFLDLFSLKGIRKDDVALSYLDKAVNYFGYAVRQYGDARISEHALPYGELSLVHYHRSRLLKLRQTKEREFNFSGQVSRFSRIEEIKQQQFLEQTFSRSEYYAKLHLRKATNEENQREMVIALLALGDANLLFRRKISASNYYKLAWEEAQKLADDDPLVQSMQEPVRLPAFKFAIDKEEPRRPDGNYTYLPVITNVDANGKVSRIEQTVVGAPSDKLASRARRIVKNSRFRPAIINGQMSSVQDHQENIRVLVSKR